MGRTLQLPRGGGTHPSLPSGPRCPVLLFLGRLPLKEKVRGQSLKNGVLGPDGERLTGYYTLSFALCWIVRDFPEFFEAEKFFEPIPLPGGLRRYGERGSSSLFRFSPKARGFGMPRFILDVGCPLQARRFL